MLVSLAAAALSAALAAAPDTSPRADVPALVRRCVAAYGGKAALARAARSWVEGTATSVVLHPGEAGRIVRVYERPSRLRVDIAYGGGPPEVRVLDGRRGWRDGQEASGPRLDAMILQAARLDLPAALQSAGGKLKDGGTADLDGTPVRLLAIEPGPGLMVEAAIDPATGRILRTRGASIGGEMTLEFVTTYSEFKQVDGVLVATREENWANGKSTGVTLLQKVSFPAKLPANAFAP